MDCLQATMRSESMGMCAVADRWASDCVASVASEDTLIDEDRATLEVTPVSMRSYLQLS